MNLILESYVIDSNNDSPETFKRREPVSITDLQTHSRLPTILIPPANDPIYIEGFISAAREMAEYECQIQCLTAIYELQLDGFPGQTPNFPYYSTDTQNLFSIVPNSIYDLTIPLPKPPLQEVLTVEYDDASGVTQLIYDSSSPLINAGLFKIDGSQRFERPIRPGELYLAAGKSWPTTLNERNAVRIRFQCGFGDNPVSVPFDIRYWIMNTAATMYEHREKVIVGATVSNLEFVKNMLMPWRAERKIV